MADATSRTAKESPEAREARMAEDDSAIDEHNYLVAVKALRSAMHNPRIRSLYEE